MRGILLIAFFCFLAVAATGCKKAQLRRQLKELMGATIVLPEKITCVYNGEVYPMPDSLREKAKLIIYIDSTECSTCRISSFWKYRELYDLSTETRKFILLLLMGNTSFESIPLQEYLCDSGIVFPVYVDNLNSFLRINPAIPSDRRMHSFLIDCSGHAVFVGDPGSSVELFDILIKT